MRAKRVRVADSRRPVQPTLHWGASPMDACGGLEGAPWGRLRGLGEVARYQIESRGRARGRRRSPLTVFRPQPLLLGVCSRGVAGELLLAFDWIGPRFLKKRESGAVDFFGTAWRGRSPSREHYTSAFTYPSLLIRVPSRTLNSLMDPFCHPPISSHPT